MSTEIAETFDGLIRHFAILNDIYDHQYDLLTKNCQDYRKFLQFVSKPKPTKNSDERIQPPHSNITSGDSNATETISILSQNEFLAIESLLQKSKLIRHEQFRKPIDAKRAISPKNLPLIKPATKEKLENVAKNRCKDDVKISRRQSTSCIKSSTHQQAQVSNSASRTGAIPKEKVNFQSRNEPKNVDLGICEIQANEQLKFPFEVQKAMRLNKHAVESSKKCLFSECSARNDFLDKIRGNTVKVESDEVKLVRDFVDLRNKTDAVLSNSDLNADEMKNEIEIASEKFQKLDFVYKRLTKSKQNAEKQKFMTKIEPKFNLNSCELIQDFLQAQTSNDISPHDDVKQILKLNDVAHSTQRLKLQLHIHETLQKSVIPEIQTMHPDDTNFIPLVKCVYSLLCSEGDSFPIFVKEQSS